MLLRAGAGPEGLLHYADVWVIICASKISRALGCEANPLLLREQKDIGFCSTSYGRILRRVRGISWCQYRICTLMLRFRNRKRHVLI